MKLAPAPRWAISFADLSLVLVGCFAMLHAMRTAPAPSAAPAAAETVRSATTELVAAELFEPGEARLTESGRLRLELLAGTVADRRIALASRGVDGGGGRLDAFELAAARTAAVARQLGAVRRPVSTTVGSDADGSPGQRISLRFVD